MIRKGRTARAAGPAIMIAVVALVWAAAAAADTHLSGTLGADLGMYEFSNSIFEPPQAFRIDRRVTNQFLDLNLSGPVVKDEFATYLARVRLRGTQIRSDTDSLGVYDALSPDASSYHGEISVFSDRKYPLRFYTGRQELNAVRFEAANRSETDILLPALAVVRRYETTNAATGVIGRYSVNDDLELGFEAKQTANTMTRRYDFDENRNIQVEFMQINQGNGPWYNVEVINTIPDRDVVLFVDYALRDTIPAGGIKSIVLEEGRRTVDFVPAGLNRYSTSVTIDADMAWTILFQDPPGAKDLDQTNDIVTGRLDYEGDGPFKTEFNFEVNDGDETVQRQTTKLRVLNNMATYQLTPNANLRMLTNYASNLSDVADISHQESRMFTNQTTGKWARGRGPSASVMHSLIRLNSETGSSEVSSTNNIVNAQANIPSGWNQHELAVIGNVNALSDSKDFTSSMYSAEVKNQMILRTGGFRWLPRHAVKYSDGTQTNPGADGLETTDTSEWENKLMLDGENRELGPLGALQMRSEYSWRQRDNAKGTDTTNKYRASADLNRKFKRGYRVKVGVGWEKEAFGLEAYDEDGRRIEVPGRDDEVRSTVRGELQINPWTGFDITGSAMRIYATDTDISKYMVMLALRIPKLNIPIKSFLIKERREMTGARPQELLRLETKASYNFRKIRLVLLHQYTDEVLLTENYTYGEFSVRVSRDFNVF